MLQPAVTTQIDVQNKIAQDEDVGSREEIVREGMEAFAQLRKEAAKNGLQDMTLKEINVEIAAARRERNVKGA